MSQQSILITGTSSGIGLGLVKYFAKDDKFSKVFALARKSDAPALVEVANQHKGKVFIVKSNPEDLDSAKSAAKEVEKILGDKGLDVLINNIGGANFQKSVLEITADHLKEMVSSNIITTHHVSIASAGTSKKVVNISSLLGSVTEADGRYTVPTPAYSTAKAGVNMLTRWYANEFGASKGITFVALSPGYVAVERNPDPNAISVEESAKGIASVLAKVTPKDSANLYSYDGSIHPW